MENFVTGDILVRWEDKDWIFRNKTDFIAFFIRCAGLEDTAVYFNSLSYPFFASQALSPNGFRDALFWHEPVDGEIPGNMQIILHDQGTRAKRIFVSHKDVLRHLSALNRRFFYRCSTVLSHSPFPNTQVLHRIFGIFF